MNKTNIEAQEELAFDMMDDMLDRASWKPGVVVLKAAHTVVFCYDLPQLRIALLEQSTKAVKAKFKQCDAKLEPVVQNIIEEYAAELKKYRIFERTAPKLKRAQG